MLDTLSRYDYVPYLFRLKRWQGSDATYKVWDDMLSEFQDEIIKYVVKKAIESDEHVDCAVLYKWGKEKINEVKNIYINKRKNIIGFCSWCLKDREFDTMFEDWYCTVCSEKYNKEKTLYVKEAYYNGELNEVKRKREDIISKKFDFVSLGKYLEENFPQKKYDPKTNRWV